MDAPQAISCMYSFGLHCHDTLCEANIGQGKKYVSRACNYIGCILAAIVHRAIAEDCVRVVVNVPAGFNHLSHFARCAGF